MTGTARALAANCRAERARRNINMEDVAEAMRGLGFSNWYYQTVYKIEHGRRRLLAEEVVALAAVLDVPVDRLLMVAS